MALSVERLLESVTGRFVNLKLPGYRATEAIRRRSQGDVTSKARFAIVRGEGWGETGRVGRGTSETIKKCRLGIDEQTTTRREIAREQTGQGIRGITSGGVSAEAA